MTDIQTSATTMAPVDDQARQGANLANWRLAPFSQWSFSHVSELIPSAMIAHDPSCVAIMEEVPSAMGAIAYKTRVGEVGTVASMLANSSTDGFLVLHRGTVVAEHYAGQFARHRSHIVFPSANRSLGHWPGCWLAQANWTHWRMCFITCPKWLAPRMQIPRCVTSST